MAIDEGGATHRAFEDLPAACHGDDGPFIGLKSAYQRMTKKFTELLSQFFHTGKRFIIALANHSLGIKTTMEVANHRPLDKVAPSKFGIKHPM